MAGVLLFITAWSTRYLLLAPYCVVWDGVVHVSTRFGVEAAAIEQETDFASVWQNLVSPPAVEWMTPHTVTAQLPLSLPVVVLVLAGRALQRRRCAVPAATTQ
jgi:hypothetical protein